MLKLLFYIYCCLGCLVVASAASLPHDSSVLQNHPRPFVVAKHPSVDPILKVDSSSSVIPFSKVGNLILVRAKVDTTEGNFILDTGAPGLVLNLTYFRNYPIQYAADEEQGGIAGTAAQVAKTTAKEAVLGGFHYYKAEADVVNLSNIENNKGVKVLGLLGMQLFKQCEMIIDYEQNLIHLHLVNKKEAASYQHKMLGDTSLYSTFAIELNDLKPILKTELAGKKVRFLIDCAAESNVLDSRLPNKIFELINVNQRVVLAGVGNAKVEAVYGDLEQLRIGNRIFDKLPVLVTNLEKTCLSFGGCIDGILGFEFLALHKVGFNFVTNKMYVWK